MNTLNDIFKNTELASRKNTQSICEFIISELQQLYRVNFRDGVGSLSAGSIIQIILLHPDYRMYHKALIRLLHYYEVNEYSLLWRLVNLMYQYQLTEEARNIFTNSLSMLPFHKGIDEVNNCLEVKTNRGVLKIYNLRDWLKSDKLNCCIRSMDIQGHCHEIVQIFKDDFSNDLITTSQLSDLFGGHFYHSYYSLIDGRGVVDLANNTYYEGSCFDEVFCPKEIIKYPAFDLDRRYNELVSKDKKVPSTMAPVLSLALNENRH